MDYCSKYAHRLSRKWKSIYISSKILVIVAILEVIFVFAVGIARILSRDILCADDDRDVCRNGVINQTVTYWLWVLFFFVNIYDGMFHDNLYELYSATFQAAYLNAWSIFRSAAPNSPKIPADIVLLVVTSAAQLIYFIISFLLYKEYVWRFYRKAGADKSFRAAYATYQIWFTFLRLDVVYGICCAFLSGLGVFNTTWPLAIDIIMILYLIAFWVIGYYAVSREIHRLMFVWALLFPLAPAYEIYYMYDQWEGAYGLPVSSVETRTAILYTLSAVVAVLCRFALVVVTPLVYRNFGKGLKKLAYLAKNDDSDFEEKSDEAGETDTNTNSYVAYDAETNNMSVKDVIQNTLARTGQEKY